MNTDRFKFRAWIEIPLEDEAGNKKTYGFYLYYINVHDEGKAISFNEEILSDTVWDLPISGYEKSQVMSHLVLHNDMVSDTFYIYKEPKYIEQCTGLKDKSDKDIYEGDILRYATEDGEYYTGALISDRNHILRFVNFRPNECFDIAWSGIVDDVYLNHKGTLEVIGNIYEEKMRNKWEVGK